MPHQDGLPDDPEFVARAEELDALGSQIDRGNHGADPCGVVIAGPAGVGKTRLVRQWQSRHDADCFTVVATRAAGLIPFGAVAHLAPGLAAGDYDDVASWYAAVASCVRARSTDRPILIVDDAHLLDAGSAALLLHLMVSSAATIVATIRTGEHCPDPVTALWRDGLARRIDLQPFTLGETELLIGSILGGPVARRAVHRLADLCGGNPLFLREVVTAALESGALAAADDVWRWNGAVPKTPRLVDAVESRLAGLGADERSALATVALGEPLAVDLVVNLAGTQALERIERRGLVAVTGQPGGAVCSCVHPLYGEVLLAQLGFFERRRMSGELADALAVIESSSSDERLMLTRRRLEAGRAVAADEIANAAVIAGDAFDYPLAEELARTALQVQNDPATAIVLASAMNAQGRAEAAEEVLAEVADAVFATGSIELLERYVGARFDVCYMALGRRGDTLAMLDRLLALCGSGSNLAADCADLAVAERSRILVHDGCLEEVVAVTAPVRARANVRSLARLHVSETAGEALAYLGRTTSARAIHEDLRRLAAGGDRMAQNGAMWAGMQEVLCLSLEGRVDEAASIVEVAEEMTRLSADAEVRGLANMALGAIRLAQGRPRTARRPLLDGLDAYRGFDPSGSGSWALAMLAQAEALLGDVDAAQQAVDASRERRPDLPPNRSAFDFVLADAYVEMARGRTSAATGVLFDAAERFGGVTMFRVQSLYLAVMLGADPQPVVEPLGAAAAATEVPIAGRFAEHVRALADQNASALEELGEHYAGLGLSLRAAEAFAQASSAYRAQSVRAGATRTAARSRAMVARCEGASTTVLGGLDEPVELSRREREVAGLAAHGRSNREIAEELSVSVRTVESHLYQAFAKLGVEQRSELAAHFGGAPAGGDGNSVVDH